MHGRSFLFLLFGFIGLIYLVSPNVHAALSQVDQILGNEDYRPHRAKSFTEECGLQHPSTAKWNEGIGKNFTGWMDYNWKNYKDSNYSTFMQYMRGEFAPDLSASALMCDGQGSCSIGSCLNIAKGLSDFDRQMAYYAFEQIANIEHYYRTLYGATIRATNYINGAHEALVDSFSHAADISAANGKRKQTEMITTSVISSVLMIISTATGVFSAFVPSVVAVEGVVLSTGARVTNLLNSVKYRTLSMLPNGPLTLITTFYTGMNFAVKGWYSEPDVPGRVNNLFERLFTGMAHMKTQQVWKELHRLMEGGPASNGTSIAELLKSGDFIEEKWRFQEKLSQALEKAYFAIAVDALWSLDRTYIVDTDEYNSLYNCANDLRGPPRNRVCLPERPGHVYWIYNIDGGKEDDKLHTVSARVKSPVGLRKFIERPGTYYNITKEDIVRASLWAQEANLVNQPGKLINKLPAIWFTKGAHVGGTLAGTFTIPVCRNPGGEAISSVWSHWGRNYPCMCGDFSWRRSGGYTPEIDETPAFLKKTGLFASEDWEVFCKWHIKCKEDPSVQVQWPEIAGAPNQVKNVKHPYMYCKRSNPHFHIDLMNSVGRPKWLHGHPEKDL